MGLTPVNQRALDSLIVYAIEKAESAPIDEQVRVFAILSELLATEVEKAMAGQIAETLSRAAAMQAELRPESKATTDGDGNGDGK